MQLTEEQHVFIRQYLDLLNTVQEGLVFIRDQLSNEKHEHVDRMLTDIFQAFTQFHQSNQVLRDVFADHCQIISTVDDFDQLVDSIKPLEQMTNQPKEKSTFFLTEFIPSFNKWKENVEYYLANEVSH